MGEPKTFDDLVTWAVWEIIQAITKGEPLRTTLHHVLGYARQWKPS